MGMNENTLRERQCLARKIDAVSAKASLEIFKVCDKECPELSEDDESFDLFCSDIIYHLMTDLHNYRISDFTHRGLEEETE